jgi:hypothetical protein
MATPEENKQATAEEPKRSFVGTPEPQPEKKLGTSELLERIYEVEVYIGKTLKDQTEILAQIRDELVKNSKQVVVKNATITPVEVPAATPLPPAPTSSAPDVKLAKIMTAFPEEILSLININSEDNNMFFIIKPKQFLGSENFAKIASAVRGLGGEYVSQGRESHFRISKAT